MADPERNFVSSPAALSQVRSQSSVDGAVLRQQSSAKTFDSRVRIRPKTGAMDVLLPAGNGSIVAPLRDTMGLVFPYTPTVNFNQSVDYQTYDPVHTNQEFLSYVRTRSPALSISGKFSANNEEEARYSLAAIQFVRSVTKMVFGFKSVGTGVNVGSPPPVLLFSGYGTLMFNEVPVLVIAATFDLPDDVDYKDVVLNGTGTARVPTLFNISMSLTVQNSPNRLREEFNYREFVSGKLLTQGGWT